jgi:hypothetical protein
MTVLHIAIWTRNNNSFLLSLTFIIVVLIFIQYSRGGQTFLLAGQIQTIKSTIKKLLLILSPKEVKLRCFSPNYAQNLHLQFAKRVAKNVWRAAVWPCLQYVIFEINFSCLHFQLKTVKI